MVRTSRIFSYRQCRPGTASRRRSNLVAELRKVVWPTQQQVVTYFFVVLVFVLVMMAYVSGLDFAFGKAVFEIFA